MTVPPGPIIARRARLVFFWRHLAGCCERPGRGRPGARPPAPLEARRGPEWSRASRLCRCRSIEVIHPGVQRIQLRLCEPRPELRIGPYVGLFPFLEYGPRAVVGHLYPTVARGRMMIRAEAAHHSGRGVLNPSPLLAFWPSASAPSKIPHTGRSRPRSDSSWSLLDRARCRSSSKRQNSLGGRFFRILSERDAVRACRRRAEVWLKALPRNYSVMPPESHQPVVVVAAW